MSIDIENKLKHISFPKPDIQKVGNSFEKLWMSHGQRSPRSKREGSLGVWLSAWPFFVAATLAIFIIWQDRQDATEKKTLRNMRYSSRPGKNDGSRKKPVLNSVVSSAHYQYDSQNSGYNPVGLGKLKPGKDKLSFIFYKDVSGLLHAFDMDKLEDVWTFNTGKGIGYVAPTVSDGYVYVTSSLNPSETLYCLDAQSGDKIWEGKYDFSPMCSPLIYKGIVYLFGNEDNDAASHLLALDNTNGKELWKIQLKETLAGVHACISHKQIYVTTLRYNLMALDVKDGSKKWAYLLQGDSVGPTIVEDKIFIGSRSGDFFCLNAVDGTRIWKTSCNGQFVCTPAYGNGKVFCGNSDGQLYAMDETNGDILWKSATQDSIYSSPTVCDDLVYTGSYDNSYYAFNVKDGNLVWKYRTGRLFNGCGACALGRICFISRDGHIYLLNAKTGGKLWSQEIGEWVAWEPVIASTSNGTSQPFDNKGTIQKDGDPVPLRQNPKPGRHSR